jgi:predicted  nucleic acid-binding Zn-ribbon protein
MPTYLQQLRAEILAARENVLAEKEDVATFKGHIQQTQDRLDKLQTQLDAAQEAGDTALVLSLTERVNKQTGRLGTLRESLSEQKAQLASAREGLAELRESKAERTNFMQQASLLMSFMPPQAIKVYSQYYAEYAGDSALALAAFRADDRYQNWFPGNTDPSGRPILSESDYVDTITGYQLKISQYGLNPAVFASRIPDLIQGHVSVTEFEDRLGMYYNGLQQNIAQVREWYAFNYGLADLTDESLLAATLDPSIASDVLTRRIGQAQIGGEAAEHGFGVGQDMTAALLAGGYAQTTAHDLFARAALFVPRLGAAAARGLLNQFGIHEYVAAEALGDASAAGAIQRLVNRESSLFSEQGKVAGFEQGALTGLREQ